MERTLRLPVLAALAVLVPFGVLNAVLALDLAWRIWTLRAGFGRPLDAQLLILVEVARALATLLALSAAVRLGAARSALERGLGLCLAFLAIAYVQAFTFPAFPGPLQEALARGLLGAGVSRGVLVLVFGTPAWALWCALGAALRAGAAGSTAAAGAGGSSAGRRGMLRGSGIAGADVGAGLRSLAAAAAARGWLRRSVVWPAVLLLVVLQVAGPPVLALPLALVFAVGAGVALARLRVERAAADAATRVRLDWFACAAAIAIGALLVGGALALVVPRAEWAPLIVLAGAPLGVAACVVGAAFARRAPGRTLGRVARGGALALVAVIAFGVADTLLAVLFEAPPYAAVVAAGVVAAVAVALARRPLSRAERALMRPDTPADAERRADAHRSG